MGMITRVRARLQSLSVPHRCDGKPQEDRNTKTMCVLSALLLVPCFARLPSTFLFGSVAVAYCVVVLPILLSGLSKKRIMTMIDSYVAITQGIVWCHFQKSHTVFLNFVKLKNHFEMCFLKMGNISTLLNQILFFAMCDRFFCPDQRLTCLYSLMFYNVIAYCVAYVQQILSKEDWSPYVHISETTNVKHLAMTTTKIVLELTKAVTFLITAVFMLLVFGLEQGLEHYHPTWTYIFVTSFYYMFTEKTFSQNVYILLEYMELEVLEGLEKLWAPVILKLSICVLSGLISLPLIVFGFFRFTAFAMYINVFLAYKDLAASSWATLQQECAAMAKYRYATRDEVHDIDDVCAVCLQSMKFARVTPCHHMFHGDCLRLCLKESTACPMCKQEL